MICAGHAPPSTFPSCAKTSLSTRTRWPRRAAGADALLLIVSALRQDDLVGLLGEVRRLGMEALVETHDRQEVARALAAGARVIGVNHRNLDTLQVDMTLATAMRPLVPSDCLLVAESGIQTADDVRRMDAAGIDAILVVRA